ncbi:hypothetical protein ACVW1A_006437 [Bradyrhizobium sp. LB1.3]|jgi:hypothetical protein
MALVTRFLELEEQAAFHAFAGTNCRTPAFSPHQIEEEKMRKYLFAAAMVTAIAAPAFADEVGVHVGPVGAGVTVGQSHEYRERDRDRDRTTVVKEREPADRTTVIKKEDELGNRSKTVIHHDND